jgi:hypothetical protein
MSDDTVKEMKQQCYVYTFSDKKRPEPPPDGDEDGVQRKGV